MRATLFPFQESALADLHEKIKKAHAYWSEKDPQGHFVYCSHRCR